MKKTILTTTFLVAACAAGAAWAAGNQADKPKPLDPVANAKYVADQGGLVQPPDNGNRILIWDATGKAGEAVTTFTNIASRSLFLPFVVSADPVSGGVYVAAKAARSERTPVVVLISEDGDNSPALSVFPEEAIGCINYSALTGGDSKKTMNRVEKELFRSLGFALGGYSISKMACVMDTVYSRDELDANPVMLLSPMRRVGINKAIEKLKIPSQRKTLYSVAVRQGWAPPPTNNVQKAIWDKMHAVPARPMKIEFDPKKGR